MSPSKYIADESPVVFYDGECLFCSEFIQFVQRRDHRHRIFFAPLQGETAAAFAQKFPMDLKDLDTIYFVRKGRLFSQSGATLRILTEAGGLLKILGLFLLVPPFIRNFFYKIVARHRKEIMDPSKCEIPSPEFRAQILK
jgi:predicted DCC family thiol-disulfide oxidoreductase YuxK